MKSKQPLHQPALVPVGRGGVDGHRQAAGVHPKQDFHAFSDLRATGPVTTAASLAEGGVDEALLEPVRPTLLDPPAGPLHDPLEDALADPALESAVHGAPGTEAPRQILPLGAIVQHPEGAGQHLVLVGRRPSAFRAAWRIGNLLDQPVR